MIDQNLTKNMLQSIVEALYGRDESCFHANQPYGLKWSDYPAQNDRTMCSTLTIMTYTILKTY